MKKMKYLLLLCTATLLLTGCVKFNANMDIRKNKSMDFSIIYALDTSLFGDQQILEDDDKKALENQGFTVTEYSKDNMKGFTISQKIKNIDTVSSTSDVEYSLSGISGEKIDNYYIFKVKKGFLKNTYTAKLKFDASDSGLNDTTSDPSLDSDWSWDMEDSDDSSFDWSSDPSLDSELSGMMANLDLKFNVNLPYAAKSHNASDDSGNNKNLSWNLSSNKIEAIEFEFELYNMTIIYIGIGVVALLAIIVIATIVNKGKKNDDRFTKSVPPVQQQFPINNQPQASELQQYSYTEKEFQQMSQPQVNQQPNQASNLQTSQQSTADIQPNQSNYNNPFNKDGSM